MTGRLERRLADLENKAGAFAPWVSIIQRAGQTEDQAVAAYEADHGPVGDSNKILWVVVRKPGAVHA
ncbi:hypothetical protein KYN89_02460 [Alteriqipengyuania sp. NZ-12B]|uniref:Uncharacterized protein n=1 Tax=Alteriqipengyuania abyssalis TaxID=2860200 RepID=A0ABS7PBK6_9SPHN|nr:hypothetical protein [Alteriqipengyuania abyssalis]MBY8335903.1 hypothetical protein [Alteriqipengyuania abyssalis]